MSRIFGGLCWLVFAALFGFAWMVILPWANQKLVGNVLWAALTLLFFCLLLFGAGVVRRVSIWFGVLSVLSGVVTLQGPASEWPWVLWLDGKWPRVLHFFLPNSDVLLFFMCLLLLMVGTLLMPAVRRVLVPQRTRDNPFD